MSDPANDTVVRAPTFEEQNGTLYVFDTEQLPFVVRRVFFVRAPQGATRGSHAHRECQQFLVVVAGRIDVTTTDVHGTRKSTLLNVGDGMHLPAMIWTTQYFVEPDSILVVLCDLTYAEDDYIRDRPAFDGLKPHHTGS